MVIKINIKQIIVIEISGIAGPVKIENGNKQKSIEENLINLLSMFIFKNQLSCKINLIFPTTISTSFSVNKE